MRSKAKFQGAADRKMIDSTGRVVVDPFHLDVDIVAGIRNVQHHLGLVVGYQQ